MACLLVVAAAALVAISGGFRQRIGPWRIAVTSPYPLLIWAAIIGVARHFAAPQRPIYRDLPGRIAQWVRTRPVLAAGRVIVGTRPAMLLVGYVAVLTIGYMEGRAPVRYFNNELMNLPVRWDATWYLEIANEGYRYTPDDPDKQQNVVFFPAYPMLVRGVGQLLGRQITGYTAAGVLVSLAAFFGALVYLYLMARETIGEDNAPYALWLLAAYPFAIFFGAVYTESLFLLGTTGAFYHFQKREFQTAALWGVLVGLTRANGMLLAAPLGLLAMLNMRASARALAAAAAPVLGTLLYTAYVWQTTGHPLAWATGQAAWGRRYQGLDIQLRETYSYISKVGVAGYLATPGLEALNAIALIFVVASVWPVFRRLGLAYAVFLLVNILPPVAAGGLLSVGRFSSVLFPIFIWLAGAVPPRHRLAWLTGFTTFQTLNAVLFYTWRPLF